MRVTVYPSVAGGFPPASFWSDIDALTYMRQLQSTGADCGLCQCPAGSYDKHYADTVRN